LPDTLESLSQATKTGTVEEFIQQFGRPSLRLVLDIENKLSDPKAIAQAIEQSNYELASVRFDLIDACFEAGDRDSALRELEGLFESTRKDDMPEIHIESAARLAFELGIINPWSNNKTLGKCLNTLDQALSRSQECTHKGIVLLAKQPRLYYYFC
jgi:hypothetical protein